MKNATMGLLMLTIAFNPTYASDCASAFKTSDKTIASLIKSLKCIESKSTPIGSIVASVLSFEQFSTETSNYHNGRFDPTISNWAPADGRSVHGSKYAARYNNKAPDLRGQFIRGANIMYSSDAPDNYLNGKDPDERKLIDKYSYQEQSTKIPGNAFKGKTDTTPDHRHAFTAVIRTGSPDQLPPNGGPMVASSASMTEPSGKHEHEVYIISGGDNETRPRNIAVYYYIRIN